MSAFSYPLVILLLSLTIFVSEAFAGLREVVVSHTDEKGVLQLFRMKEDGSDSM